MERMYANTEMERVFTRSLGDVLISANTRGFECLAGQLLVLVRDKMTTEREVLDGSLLTA